MNKNQYLRWVLELSNQEYCGKIDKLLINLYTKEYKHL